MWSDARPEPKRCSRGSESQTVCVLLPLCQMIQVISHRSSLVVLALGVHIDVVAVQGPDKGDVQGRVVRGGTLHQGILTSFNVGTERCQADLCRL